MPDARRKAVSGRYVGRDLMFIDTSAFLAIMLAEADANDLLIRLKSDRRKPVTSPVVRYEVVLSLARSAANGRPVTPADVEAATDEFDQLLKLLDCSEQMLTETTTRLAVLAQAEFGKAAQHPADLNLGDTLVYAGAKQNRRSLLYKGDNFAQTDLA